MDEVYANKKRSLVILWSIIILIVLLVLGYVGWQMFGPTEPPDTAVVKQTSLVEEQATLENDFVASNYDFLEPKVVVNPYKISPLTALVIFRTVDPQSATVTIKGKDALSTISYTFPVANDHRLPIYGLYPGQDNQVDIKVGTRTKTLTIKTEPLPEDFPKVLNVKSQRDKLNNQLYFMTGMTANAKTVAYDVNGDVRWYLLSDLTWDVKRSKTTGRLLLSTERIMREPNFRTGLYEIDLLGKIYNEFSLPGGYHDSYYERQNGNLIVATSEPGRASVADVVVEIDRQTGNVIKKIDLSRILSTDTGKSLSWTKNNWFANNSVWLDEDRNELVLSGANQDAVVILDYETTRIKYIVGSSSDWAEGMKQYMLKMVAKEGDESQWFWSQHSARALANGDLLVFDNGNGRSKDPSKAIEPSKRYSRASIYRIDRDKKTIQLVWNYGQSRGNAYYSPYGSGVDFLGSGHYLVHSGGYNSKDGKATGLPAEEASATLLRSFTTEVLNDQVVFELVSDSNFYQAEKLPAYAKDEPILHLGRARQLGQAGESVTCSDILVRNVRKMDEDYARYDIKLSQEHDRLVLSGNFDKKSSLRIILKNNSFQQIYDAPIGTTLDAQSSCARRSDGEALSGETRRANAFVNKRSAGAQGRLKVYVAVDGVIYDTKQFVDF